MKMTKDQITEKRAQGRRAFFYVWTLMVVLSVVAGWKAASGGTFQPHDVAVAMTIGFICLLLTSLVVRQSMGYLLKAMLAMYVEGFTQVVRRKGKRT